MIVLDTNVVSDLMRSEPTPSVIMWMRSNTGEALYTTTITIAEIRFGIARLPQGRRRDSLHQAANEIFAAFPRQVLSFDLAAAGAYADIAVGRRNLGAPIDSLDAQIAAICHSQSAVLATRTIKDFADTGVALVNPWDGVAP